MYSGRPTSDDPSGPGTRSMAVAPARTRSTSEGWFTVVVPIDIGVMVTGNIDDALRRLRITGTASTVRDVWYAEACAGLERGRLSLLSGGIVLRMRSAARSGSIAYLGECARADVTVMLRPRSGSRLTGQWAESFDGRSIKYRVAGEWCGPRRGLVASATSKVDSAVVSEAVAAGGDPGAALNAAQRHLMVTCAPHGVAVDRLVALGAVRTRTWRSIEVGSIRVVAQRYRVRDADLLRLNTRVEPWVSESGAAFITRAASVHRGLHELVRPFGDVESDFESTLGLLLNSSARKWCAAHAR